MEPHPPRGNEGALLELCFPPVCSDQVTLTCPCGSARLRRVIVGEQQLGEAARRGEGAPV